MNQHIQIDKRRFWEMANQGATAEELQKEFTIRDMTTLKQIAQAVMEEMGESVEIPGLVDRASLRAKYLEDGIRISPQMLRDTGFKAGDEFDLKVTDTGIELKKG